MMEESQPYLLYGTFERPPHLDIPDMEVDMSRSSIYAGQQETVQAYRKRVPQYLVGVWRAEDGNIAVAIANIADLDQKIQFTLSREEHGLPDQGRLYRRNPGGRTDSSTALAEVDDTRVIGS